MINFDHTTNNVGVYDEGKLAIALISRESDGGGGRSYEQVRGLKVRVGRGVRFVLY